MQNDRKEIAHKLESTIGAYEIDDTRTPNLVVALNSDATLAAFRSINTESTAVVGRVRTTGDSFVRVPLHHTSTCGAVNIPLTDNGKGGQVDLGDGTGVANSGLSLGTPWALSDNGAVLETWYELESSSTLVQVVDVGDYSGMVTFDPSYYNVACGGYYSSLDAITYLNLDPANPPHCAVRGLFISSTGYLPRWGDQPSVRNDFGLIMVRMDGGCSTPGYELDYIDNIFDFSVPCRAHDYCFDLRRAGFGGTVTDSDCNGAFYLLMLADCNDRQGGARDQCEAWAS